MSEAAAPSRRTSTGAITPVLGEIGYLLQSRVGPQAEVTFLKSFGDDGFHIAELEDQDIPRMAELVETYIDLPLGIVDAAVIAIAERLRLTMQVTASIHDFAGSLWPAEEQIRQQGKQPIASVDELAFPGVWASDEELDEFLADLYASRRTNVA